jgi:DNA-binding CsgD family transcriptional regulator
MDRLGLLAIHLGDIEAADQWYQQCCSIQEERNLRYGHWSHPYIGLGDVARARGQHIRALRHYQDALRIGFDARDVRGNAYLLGAIAGTLAVLGDVDLAGRLFGASEAYHERILFPFERVTFDRLRAFGLPEPWARRGDPHGIAGGLFVALERQTQSIRFRSIEPERARTWWSEGRKLTFEEATTLALEARTNLSANPKTFHGLSSREVDVLRLLALGQTDQEIATTLSISPRTASNHVHHIYTKLNIASRAAATAWAIRHDIA